MFPHFVTFTCLIDKGLPHGFFGQIEELLCRDVADEPCVAYQFTDQLP